MSAGVGHLWLALFGNAPIPSGAGKADEDQELTQVLLRRSILVVGDVT